MKKVLFYFENSDGWIAGLYYVRNLLYMLCKALPNKSEEKYIYIFIEEHKKYYIESILEEYKGLNIVIYKNPEVDILNSVIDNKIELILPVNLKIIEFLDLNSIYWIPDFQHKTLPHFFEKIEIETRDTIINKIIETNMPVILSSDQASVDFFNYFGQVGKVVHFVSYIEEYVNGVGLHSNEIKSKYNLREKYYYLPNQFWIHKNHKMVFEAINDLKKKYSSTIQLVCTGALKDYRNNELIDELLEFIDKHELKDTIKVLGYLPREEQLSIMYSSFAVIQPSLFEGWNTSIEDAKRLGKRMIVSDIEVHKEQDNGDMYFFKKDDKQSLIDVILRFEQTYACEIFCDLDKGKLYFDKYSVIYGKKLYELICDTDFKRIDYYELWSQNLMLHTHIRSIQVDHKQRLDDIVILTNTIIDRENINVELNRRIEVIEEDREERLKSIKHLIEDIRQKDDVITELYNRIDVIENDREERLKAINQLTDIIHYKEDIINELNKRIELIENDREERLKAINQLTEIVHQKEDIINELNKRIEIIESDRGERLKAINELTDVINNNNFTIIQLSESLTKTLNELNELKSNFLVKIIKKFMRGKHENWH